MADDQDSPLDEYQAARARAVRAAGNALRTQIGFASYDPGDAEEIEALAEYILTGQPAVAALRGRTREGALGVIRSAQTRKESNVSE